jgi:hypothetical protein
MLNVSNDVTVKTISGIRFSTESCATESEQGNFRGDAEADGDADGAQAAIDVDERRRRGGCGG